jgi:hypothetical protein
METFHFISQRWFAVEKDDGKVKYLLLNNKYIDFVVFKLD